MSNLPKLSHTPVLLPPPLYSQPPVNHQIPSQIPIYPCASPYHIHRTSNFIDPNRHTLRTNFIYPSIRSINQIVTLATPPPDNQYYPHIYEHRENFYALYWRQEIPNFDGENPDGWILLFEHFLLVNGYEAMVMSGERRSPGGSRRCKKEKQTWEEVNSFAQGVPPFQGRRLI